MGKEKIVLDTNILVSALGWSGNARTIFLKVINDEFELIISGKQIKELIRVLNYPKFKFTDGQKSNFLSIILAVATLIEMEYGLDVVKEDPTDNVFLESALVGKAGYLITGDNHLLKLKNYKDIRILTPKQFLDILTLT